MKIIVIGSVAAGTSVAAKARRNDETAEIVVYEAAEDISYSVCGMPYFLGGEVESIDKLTPRDPKWFKKRFEFDIHTNHHVKAIHPDIKEIEVYDKTEGRGFRDSFDKLVLATGSYSMSPPQMPKAPKLNNSFVIFSLFMVGDFNLQGGNACSTALPHMPPPCT